MIVVILAPSLATPDAVEAISRRLRAKVEAQPEIVNVPNVSIARERRGSEKEVDGKRAFVHIPGVMQRSC